MLWHTDILWFRNKEPILTKGVTQVTLSHETLKLRTYEWMTQFKSPKKYKGIAARWY